MTNEDAEGRHSASGIHLLLGAVFRKRAGFEMGNGFAREKERAGDECASFHGFGDANGGG
jgi:hypothetical protein